MSNSSENLEIVCTYTRIFTLPSENSSYAKATHSLITSNNYLQVSNPPDWIENVIKPIRQKFPQDNFDVVRIRGVENECDAYRIQCNVCVRQFVIRKGQMNFVNHLRTKIHLNNKRIADKKSESFVSESNIEGTMNDLSEQTQIYIIKDKENEIGDLNENRKRPRSPSLKTESRDVNDLAIQDKRQKLAPLGHIINSNWESDDLNRTNSYLDTVLIQEPESLNRSSSYMETVLNPSPSLSREQSGIMVDTTESNIIPFNRTVSSLSSLCVPFDNFSIGQDFESKQQQPQQQLYNPDGSTSMVQLAGLESIQPEYAPYQLTTLQDMQQDYDYATSLLQLAAQSMQSEYEAYSTPVSQLSSQSYHTEYGLDPTSIPQAFEQDVQPEYDINSTEIFPGSHSEYVTNPESLSQIANFQSVSSNYGIDSSSVLQCVQSGHESNLGSISQSVIGSEFDQNMKSGHEIDFSSLSQFNQDVKSESESESSLKPASQFDQNIKDMEYMRELILPSSSSPSLPLPLPDQNIKSEYRDNIITFPQPTQEVKSEHGSDFGSFQSLDTIKDEGLAESDSDCEVIDLTDVTQVDPTGVVKTEPVSNLPLHGGFVSALSVSRDPFPNFTDSRDPFPNFTDARESWNRGSSNNSSDIHELIRMIPLEEVNETPLEEASRKINSQNGAVDGLRIKLMDHQIVGVSWMVDCEKKDNGTRGGILADDMGLGKTIQTIATLVVNRSKSNIKSTLIVAPTALIHQWEAEILDKTEPGTFKIHVYHGPGKANLRELKKYDIVITTYQTLIRDLPDDPEEDKGPMFRVTWFRVVLDEAQNIKNRLSRISKGCAALNTIHRWCLTGTPIQNQIDDLYSYFRFLRVFRYSEWSAFRKEFGSTSERAMRKIQAFLRGILLRRTKDSKINGKPLLQLPEKSVDMVCNEFSPDERQFYDALEKRSRVIFNRYLKAGSVLKNYAYILVLLLRLRQACNHPFLTQVDVGDVISISDNPQTGPSKPMDPEQELERAKQVLSDKIYERLIEKFMGDNPNEDCPICYDVIEKGMVTACGHIFCLGKLFGHTIVNSACFYLIIKMLTESARPNIDCIKNVFEGDNQANVIDVEDRKCPLCRSPIKESDLIGVNAFTQLSQQKNSPDEEEVELPTLSELLSQNTNPSDDGEDSEEPISNGNAFASASEGTFVPSTKINRLMHELALGQEEDPGCKTIVFSQWTSMLDLIEEPISKAGYKFCRYDGTMDAKERTKAIQKLSNDPEILIMLVSLKAGGVGLNLTKANRVIMLDCWWNPSIEDQAVDRVHRIGQQKNVVVKRLTIKESIEDRILVLQEKKRQLAAGALGEGDLRVGRLTLDDLIYLFR
ncbi:7110_t:CDS:10 [Acaulospora morrowiae]|uniref:7110_t:CDS:1 n=1 Tax=Acaulospora morrowiae TaxID=94023 RepID=A0A9N9ACH8_9GLOM|nr:7110_t:CDS:10 [Acaulospora morrowiae]